MMDAVPEVIVISDSGNTSANCSIFDLKTRSLINSYKEGKSAKKCLSLINQEYIVSGLSHQPGLKIWILNKNLHETCNMVVPGMVTALAVTSCGMFLAAGIDKYLYVWEVPTGNLLSLVEDHHTKSVSCIRFSSDGSHLITGGKDGMVLVWLLSELVASSERNKKPRYFWLDHACEVTDIHVGNLGYFSRVATVSTDMSCRIYELESGKLLTTVRVDFSISAVTMDGSEYFLILGSSDGTIHRINMFPENDAEVHYNSSEKKCTFSGHTKEVNCLSVSTTGKYLVSGSEDGDCRIWDLMNFTCIKTLSFQGPVTNAFITLMPLALKNESNHYPRLKVSTFKRSLDNNENDDAEFVMTNIQPRKLSLMHIGVPEDDFDNRILNYSEESLAALNKNVLSQEMMAVINHQMYAYALSESYNQSDSVSPGEESD